MLLNAQAGGRGSKTRRGIALVSVLLFSSVLLMMVLALFQSVKGELFVSQVYRDQTAALYLAETGLMDAISELENDSTWIAGFADKTMPGASGSYSVTFNQNGVGLTEMDSVNNFDGTADRNYRGAGQVPAGCATIIVEAKVGSQKRVLEALVRVGGGVYNTPYAMATSGQIKMSGDIRIDGRQALGDATPADGDVHSNLASTNDDLITWDGSGTASISGAVSSSGSSANAIDLSGYVPVNGTSSNQAQQNLQDVNIVGKIQANSSSTPATFNPTGTSILNPPSATDNKLYHSGPLNLQGDLVLNGVTLFVDGPVNINGSVTGEGSLYVNGDTSLQGDARITAANPDAVSLYSEGNIQLTGFNGSEYMENLAPPSSPIGQAWTQLEDSLADYHAQLQGSPNFVTGGTLDSLSLEISGAPSNAVLFPVTVPGRQHNVTQILMNELALQPASSSRDKMMIKLQDLNDIFYSHINGSSEEANALANLAQGRMVAGSFDAAIDNGEIGYKDMMESFVDNIDYRSLGTSYFQGLLFTHGAVYTENEVTILGSLVAKGNPSSPSSVINGNTVNPGDLFLNTRTTVRYIEEFFQPATSGSGGAQILLWMGR